MGASPLWFQGKSIYLHDKKYVQISNMQMEKLLWFKVQQTQLQLNPKMQTCQSSEVGDQKQKTKTKTKNKTKQNKKISDNGFTLE